MAVAQTPRTSWIEAALQALSAGGPDAVRVEALAKTLGVTKGSFYWHFDDRQALLEGVLDLWELRSYEQVVERIERDGGEPREKLSRLFAMAAKRPDILEVDIAVRDWARRDAKVAARLRRVDNQRIAFMRSLFAGFCPDPEEVEVRCLIVMSLWVGDHFLATEHGDRSRGEIAQLVVNRLLD